MDTLLHTLLGLAIAAVAALCAWAFSPIFGGAVYAGFWLYSREVTQEQAKHFDFDFKRGWNPAQWSRDKNIETWIPVVVISVVAVCVQLIVH